MRADAEADDDDDVTNTMHTHTNLYFLGSSCSMDERTNEQLYQPLLHYCTGWTIIIIHHYHDASHSILFIKACLHACKARSLGHRHWVGNLFFRKKVINYLVYSWYACLARSYSFNDYNNGGGGEVKKSLLSIFSDVLMNARPAFLLSFFISDHIIPQLVLQRRTTIIIMLHHQRLATPSFLGWYMQRRTIHFLR